MLGIARVDAMLVRRGRRPGEAVVGIAAEAVWDVESMERLCSRDAFKGILLRANGRQQLL